MKVNFTGIRERESTVKTGKVVISPNLKRETVMLDRNGNEIDPRTKQIIKKVGEDE